MWNIDVLRLVDYLRDLLRYYSEPASCIIRGMTEKRWCTNYDGMGNCTIPIIEPKPSLAERVTTTESRVHEEVLTEPNGILNFLSFHDPELLDSEKTPRKITVSSWEPVRIEHYVCGERRSRNGQKKCDCFK